MNVLFLCKANFSRSRIAAEILSAMELSNIYIKSAGTVDWGKGEDDGLVKHIIYACTGRSPAPHFPHRVTEEEVQWADLILIMDSGQDTYLRIRHLGSVHKVKMLSELNGDVRPIPNPNHLDIDALYETALMIEKYLLDGKGWLTARAASLELSRKFQRKMP